MNVFLFGHGSFYNRGCEAIVKSITELTKNKFGDHVKFILATFDYVNDKKRQDIKVDYYIRHVPNYFSIKKYLGKIAQIAGNYSLSSELKTLHLEPYIKASDVCISIGGDNYCYDKNLIYLLNSIDKKAKMAGKRLIILGASFEEFNLDEETLNDLKLFDVIIVRESISYNMLQKRGFSNIYLYPDPAFLLPMEEVNEFISQNSIGINLSPLALNYASSRERLIKEIRKFIEFILRETDLNIVLLPHVIQKNSFLQNDYNILNIIYEEHVKKAKDRIKIIRKEYTASQLKFIISKFRFFIGARTHSTIAAYSTMVPTLAIAYSTKAKGIAKDIFGTYENYVVDIRNEAEDFLTKSFEFIMKNEHFIRELLKEKMPNYTQKSLEALDIVYETKK
ncbi:polysaccharide pyruvyl transferase [Caldicellulosiruptor owensensis OL]|uniref:Polysaccharide pyruvyl transferase n=1 Tax=Caldicellulosiruptor owensensis (strain ATCC 700167 / DSM 13100 / OL) TaxID=632518 RepID=E4Q5S4_CALOW|nr:polysaccharide pyruvyl transferase family protein [Caldicellulosiruptor owensensis]ADQ05483.1 polysaccharide pyruvyl transferase [Caldicellulosiruptor owensensis OL]